MIQLDISTNGFTEAQYKQEVEAHNALASALLFQDQFWSTKAREKWVYDGDRNTDDVNILREHVVDHFTKAFTDDGSSMDTGLVSKLIHSLVSVEDNDILTVIPSFEEIKLVVFSMDPDSAPGPDGYNGHFYRACWGFIGRQISDCILLTSECVNLMENSCVDGNIAIKLDVAKAFDTLNWSFLERTLNAFGFYATFVQWVGTILASAKLSILFNGSPMGFFNCSRGVRQGDPLSPLLFCLAEEVLSKGIANLVSFGKLQTISSPRAIARRSLITRWLDIPVGKLPFTYLGVPIFIGRPKRRYFQGLADRVKSRFSQWRGSSLSMAGRVVLVNSVITSMLSHSFFVYSWPQTVLSDLRRLVWKSAKDGKLIVALAYDLKRPHLPRVPWARNALRFQELIILSGSLLHSIKMQLHEINFLSKGTMKNIVSELYILHRIGIKSRPSKAPKIIEVMWHVPSIYQVKLNTDGAARGSPGLAGFGGIFRDHLGQVLGCFSRNLGIAIALEAELQAVIHAI
ncbi:hypothetical protein ACLB2K_022935 [Fragaria x ananassa]